MKLYHGSNAIIEAPDLSMSREDIDFGRGFYLSETEKTACKWACKKHNSIVNEYDFHPEGLKIKYFSLDKEWLDFVCANRNMEKIHGYDEYDVLVGPIADDKLYSTIEMYEDGFLSANQAIPIMDCMKYGNQIVLKTEKALLQLDFVRSRKISGKEKESLRILVKEERHIANQRTEEMLKEQRRRR